MKLYKVLREHHGDKPYAKGDLRRATPQVVERLLRAGVLEEFTETTPVEILVDPAESAGAPVLTPAAPPEAEAEAEAVTPRGKARK